MLLRETFLKQLTPLYERGAERERKKNAETTAESNSSDGLLNTVGRGLDPDATPAQHMPPLPGRAPSLRRSEGAQTDAGISLGSPYSVQGYLKSERPNVCTLPPIFICLMMCKVRPDSLSLINHSCQHYHQHEPHIFTCFRLQVSKALN